MPMAYRSSLPRGSDGLRLLAMALCLFRLLMIVGSELGQRSLHVIFAGLTRELQTKGFLLPIFPRCIHARSFHALPCSRPTQAMGPSMGPSDATWRRLRNFGFFS